MSGCTAPVYGHRTESGRANCPVCRHTTSRLPARPRFPEELSRSSSVARNQLRPNSPFTVKTKRTRAGSAASYNASEWRTFEPISEKASEIARAFPELRDLFLCHAWPDRQGAAKELCDALITEGASVWFSENDVRLGSNLIAEIDKGLRNSRIGIVLVTTAMLEKLREAKGVASQELSALLATDRVIPIAYGISFDQLRAVSPLLGARSGLTISEASELAPAARKIAASAAD